MIRFIADTTFGISRAYAEAHKIKVVGLKLILDGVTTDEGFEEDWSEFYARMEKSHNFPTTSQVAPAEYEDAVNEIYAEDPCSDIVILTIAGGLSGTINSARLAVKSFPGKKVAAVDSMNVAMCSRMMAEDLVEKAEEGFTYEQILERAEYLKTKLSIQFVPATMTHLKKGGRIGKLGALFAEIISVKPIFDFRNNIVSVAAKALGLHRAAVAMIKRLPEKIKKLNIAYIHDSKNIPMLVEKVRRLLGITKPEIYATCPVFGVHIGTGAIGVACMEGD